jgi:hypothetical protein
VDLAECQGIKKITVNLNIYGKAIADYKSGWLRINGGKF